MLRHRPPRIFGKLLTRRQRLGQARRSTWRGTHL